MAFFIRLGSLRWVPIAHCAGRLKCIHGSKTNRTGPLGTVTQIKCIDSASLLVHCERKPPVTGVSPHKGPVMQCFVLFVVAILNKLLNIQSICRWFGTPWLLCDVTAMAGADNNAASNNAIIWFSPITPNDSSCLSDLHNFLSVTRLFCQSQPNTVSSWLPESSVPVHFFYNTQKVYHFLPPNRVLLNLPINPARFSYSTGKITIIIHWLPRTCKMIKRYTDDGRPRTKDAKVW